jgi:hypothetical protein
LTIKAGRNQSVPSHLNPFPLSRPSPTSSTPARTPYTTSPTVIPSFTMRLSFFLLAPVFALSASAQILPRSFNIEGCVSAATALGLLLDVTAKAAAGVHLTEESCAVSAIISTLDHALMSSIVCLPRSQPKLRLLLPCRYITGLWSWDRRLHMLQHRPQNNPAHQR